MITIPPETIQALAPAFAPIVAGLPGATKNAIKDQTMDRLAALCTFAESSRFGLGRPLKLPEVEANMVTIATALVAALP